MQNAVRGQTRLVCMHAIELPALHAREINIMHVYDD